VSGQARSCPRFNDLLFRRGQPCFFAFDLLWNAGKDHRLDTLVGSQARAQEIIIKTSLVGSYQIVDHIEGAGVALFERVCRMDLEGIVAKHKHGPYVSEREQSTWFKIRNSAYSQMVT